MGDTDLDQALREIAELQREVERVKAERDALIDARIHAQGVGVWVVKLEYPDRASAVAAVRQAAKLDGEPTGQSWLERRGFKGG
jgi:hypothetical protein